MEKEGITEDNVTWDTKDKDGNILASGIYVCLIKEENGTKKTGNIVIIR